MTEKSKEQNKIPPVGHPLLTTICAGHKTPALEIKFSTLIKPFYYPNSPTIPRYSITCILDPELHKEFLRGMQTIEKNEGVESIIKNDSVKENGEHLTTGKLLIKFQSKEKIPIYEAIEGKEEKLIKLENEFKRGDKVSIIFDILRYTKKNTMNTEYGISFKPTKIYFVKE